MTRNYSDQRHMRASSYETGDFAHKACILLRAFSVVIIYNKLVRKKNIYIAFLIIYTHIHSY